VTWTLPTTPTNAPHPHQRAQIGHARCHRPSRRVRSLRSKCPRCMGTAPAPTRPRARGTSYKQGHRTLTPTRNVLLRCLTNPSHRNMSDLDDRHVCEGLVAGDTPGRNILQKHTHIYAHTLHNHTTTTNNKPHHHQQTPPNPCQKMQSKGTIKSFIVLHRAA
jgi:hypothetical protein